LGGPLVGLEFIGNCGSGADPKELVRDFPIFGKLDGGLPLPFVGIGSSILFLNSPGFALCMSRLPVTGRDCESLLIIGVINNPGKNAGLPLLPSFTEGVLGLLLLLLGGGGLII
jgi:hypothetical protein